MQDLENVVIENKHCTTCDKHYKMEYMFCPICGKSLESDDLDISDLEEGFRSVYGRWDVSTYGNYEGSTTVDLGTFEGYIDQIALALQEKALITLKFSPAPKLPVVDLKHTASKARISFPPEAYKGDKETNEFNDLLQKLFTYRKNIKVKAVNKYSFEIKKIK